MSQIWSWLSSCNSFPSKEEKRQKGIEYLEAAVYSFWTCNRQKFPNSLLSGCSMYIVQAVRTILLLVVFDWQQQWRRQNMASVSIQFWDNGLMHLWMLRLHSYKKLWYKSYKLYDSFIVNTVIFMSDKWLLLLPLDRHNFKRTITALQKLWKLNFNLEALAVNKHTFIWQGNWTYYHMGVISNINFVQLPLWNL